MEKSIAYSLMKRIIERDKEAGKLDKAAIMDKLDAFLASDRISVEEYKELVEMIGGEQ